MIGFAEAPRAWSHTRGMASVLGYSLTTAVVEGWLSRNELGRLVDACEACGQTGPCVDWLARNVSSDTLPAFCRNSATLAALKP